MACFVTGIVSTSDVSELEKTLGEVPNIDRTKLSVITKSAQTDAHDRSFLNFIHAGGPRIDSDAFGSVAGRNSQIMTGGGGTGVPGMSSDGTGLGFLSHSNLIAAIGTLPILADEASNYNDALDDGRSVVAYECTDTDSGSIEAAMRNVGVRRVKTFRQRSS